jgi:hypothetical protein
LLSSCIDIFQHITKDNNDIDQNQIKFTVSKTIFAMANGFSGSNEKIDYEKLFDESEMNTVDMNKYEQFSATVSKVNDIMDIGYLIDMNINYRDRNTVNRINSTNTSFIPKYDGKNMIIHVDAIGDSSSSSADNGMAAAFLATGKYRLLLDKKCISNIQKVIIKTSEGETETSFLDLHTEYLIEIPIPVIYMTDIDLIIYSK